MKAVLSLFAVFCFAIVSAQAPPASIQFEWEGKDTINKVDPLGKKQGRWIIKGKHKPGECYGPDQKVEEGKYAENRKTGEWMMYYCNGNSKSKITYINGRQDGYAVTYHDNGKVNEEGQWKNNRWVGKFKTYYPNGAVQHEFTFNAGGKREGPATYYFENGQKAIEGTFADGKEAGLFKEYYENGNIKAEKTYAGGAVDVASIKEYEPKEPIAKKTEKIPDAPVLVVTKDEKTNDAVSGPVVLNGKHTLYNKNKQITKDGNFKENRLMDGKAYFYNANGILERVAMYKDGVYVGDTQANE
jgi:antitoxin component YwqK of YwqJK toxin-antitoxin module